MTLVRLTPQTSVEMNSVDGKRSRPTSLSLHDDKEEEGAAAEHA